MKNENNRSKIFSNIQIISLLTTAVTLIVALFTIVFDNKKINTENTFLMILLVSFSFAIMLAYILLIIKRINPKQYIYISYARADKEIAETIKDVLDAQLRKMSKYRFEILTADSIPYGADMSNTLQEYISKSNTVIVIVSENYILSQWCNTEFVEVLEMGKKLIPIVTDSYEDLSDLPKDISNIKALSIKECSSPEELESRLKLLAKDLVRAQLD